MSICSTLKLLIWGPPSSGKTTFIQSWMQYAQKMGAIYCLDNASHLLQYSTKHGVFNLSVSELHSRPDQLAASLSAYNNTKCILVCLCKTDQPLAEISSCIAAMNQTIPSMPSFSVLLVVVTPSELAGVGPHPKEQSRIDAETSVLTWSTQMSFCDGLFEFSLSPNPDEAAGMSEFVNGVNELAEPLLLEKVSSASATPRSQFSDSDPDIQAGTRQESAGYSPSSTTMPLTGDNWIQTSPRPLLSPTGQSPKSDFSPLGPGTSQRKTPEPSASEGASKGWLGATPRENGEKAATAATASWSSAVRPTATRSPRAWLSHAPTTPSETSNFTPLSARSTATTSSLTSPPSSANSSPTTSSNPLAATKDLKSSKNQFSLASATPTKTSPKMTSSVSTSHLPSAVRTVSHTLSGNLGLKKKSSSKFQAQARQLQYQHELDELPVKMLQKLPLVSTATLSLAQDPMKRHQMAEGSQWFTSPMRFRIQNTPMHTVCALYTNENVQLGIQVPFVTWRMNAYSKVPTEPVISSLTSVTNNGFPIAVFTDPATASNFFWIREGNGLNGNCIWLTASDSTTMSNYIRSTWPGIVYGTMKPGAFMSILMHLWAEHCTSGIPPEPKRAIDLACTDKSASRYMLEALQLFETEASSIPPLIQALHWFPYLCDLTLHGCGITDEHCVPILVSLTQNAQLKSLSLAENQISSGSTNALHGLLTRPSKRLMILDLSGNPFPHKAVTAILESLAQNSSVKRFLMSGVPIATKGNILALTQLLERNRSIMSLKLSISPASATTASTETILAPIFESLLNNTSINFFDLGLPQDSPTKENIMQIINRNAKGASSLTLAGWISEWPKLLDFVPTSTVHFQKILRASERGGSTWKGVASFTGTMEEGPFGSLTVSRDCISFTPGTSLSSGSHSNASSSNAGSFATSSFNSTGSSNGSFASNSSDSGSSDRSFHPPSSNPGSRSFQWSQTLKIGQLTTDPVLIVVYDPSRFLDPLVVTMPTPALLLEVVLCINALESSGVRGAAKPLTRSRARAMGTADSAAIDYYLDFTKIQLGDLLAPAGGSGTEVRLASVNGFECCAKIMDCARYGQDSVDSMEKEISLLIMSKQCNHIVQYLHHDKQGNSLRLFMELFPSSLRKTIRTHAETKTYFTQQQVYMLARHMLKALRFLHSQPQPIVHRDVKSDNFLVDTDLFGNFLRVKLTDFGSAKILTKGRTSSVDQGTSGYQAPEMVRPPDADGSSTLSYTTAVDIFSFGITLYEVLALERVYPNCQSRQEMDEALRNAEKYPPDFTSIPKQLLHFMLIVSPCLKRNYAERPTASELLSQLDKIAAELKLSKKSDQPNNETAPKTIIIRR